MSPGKSLRYLPTSLQMISGSWKHTCRPEKFLGSEFIDKGITGTEYLSALLQRESLCSNAYCSGLLFQSAMTPAKKTQLSFTVLPHRINWKNYKIRVIVTAAFTAADKMLLFKLKHFFHRLNGQYDIANTVHNKDELLQLLTAQPDIYI